MDNDSYGEENDKSDTDIIQECERELNQIFENRVSQISEVENECMDLTSQKSDLRPEKRKEREDSSSEEPFIEVRGKMRPPKRLLRSYSTNQQVGENVAKSDEMSKFEICVTSSKELPKQMALARLLQSENICNISKIKYKSRFKILIGFDNNVDAMKLVENQKFRDLDYCCRKTLETTMTYGLIRGVDLEFSEEDILATLKCETKIVAVKRLKRLDYSGKWVDSESVRICFQGKTLPTHVTAYEYNFTVESYTFPVTQCSGCWQFGHMIKVCPTKKILCPKCGSTEHANCDLKTYRCLNCKGLHFVLDRSCPMFRKEKEIRNIMSKENIPYRKALQLVMGKYGKEDATRARPQPSVETQSFKILEEPTQVKDVNRPTYSQVVTRAEIHKESSPERISEKSETLNKKKPKKKKSKKNHDGENVEEGTMMYEESEEEIITLTTKENKKERRFELRKLLEKAYSIWRSKESLEEKISSLIVVLFEEIKTFVGNLISGRKLFETVMDFFNINNG